MWWTNSNFHTPTTSTFELQIHINVALIMQNTDWQHNQGRNYISQMSLFFSKASVYNPKCQMWMMHNKTQMFIQSVCDEMWHKMKEPDWRKQTGAGPTILLLIRVRAETPYLWQETSGTFLILLCWIPDLSCCFKAGDCSWDKSNLDLSRENRSPLTERLMILERVGLLGDEVVPGKDRR